MNCKLSLLATNCWSSKPKNVLVKLLSVVVPEFKFAEANDPLFNVWAVRFVQETDGAYTVGTFVNYAVAAPYRALREVLFDLNVPFKISVFPVQVNDAEDILLRKRIAPLFFKNRLSNTVLLV